MKKILFLAWALVFFLLTLHSSGVSCQISLPRTGLELDAHYFSSGSISSVIIDQANSRLNGNKTYGLPCGTPRNNVDCYRNYDVSDIILSSDAGDNVDRRARCEKNLEQRHADAKKLCASGSEYTGTGGWCLNGESATQYVNFDGIQVPIPKHHVPASEGIVKVFQEHMTKNNITSVNDFGAGVGQYKGALQKKNLNFDYRAYDGAGNVEEYTKGMVKYFDLTLPLALPKADYVLSLEVGEHIPSKNEGMLIRNLHHHNCKGIILSWGVLGQGGHGHINNHANEYLVGIFEKLDYVHDIATQQKFRNADVYSWFKNSIMVFQRKVAVC